jgi:hypothetical protein
MKTAGTFVIEVNWGDTPEPDSFVVKHTGQGLSHPGDEYVVETPDGSHIGSILVVNGSYLGTISIRLGEK